MTVTGFTPTRDYDENGYSFDEASDAWKSLCENLPCSLSLQWPGYTTTKFEVTLKGEPAVIQPWKGNCPTPPGLPGGIGGEVGVYRRLSGRDIPAAFPGVPPALERWLLDRVAWLTGDSDFWWPAPDLVDESGVGFRLSRPRDGAVFFESSAEQTYWNCKWMKTVSFFSWGVTNWTWDTEVTFPHEFRMDFVVNGQSFSW
jgi:hypothetical protein